MLFIGPLSCFFALVLDPFANSSDLWGVDPKKPARLADVQAGLPFPWSSFGQASCKGVLLAFLLKSVLKVGFWYGMGQWNVPISVKAGTNKPEKGDHPIPLVPKKPFGVPFLRGLGTNFWIFPVYGHSLLVINIQ